MRIVNALLIGVAVWLLAGSAAFADVRLTIQDGQVTLVAKDATVRQILTEWARVGQTKIVNVERIPGGPLTLEFQNMPEEQALDVLLRSVSGYMVAPRAQDVATLSRFDRIVVMPTSAAPRAPVMPAGQASPVFQQPQFAQPQQPADDEPEDPAANAEKPGPRGPVFNAFPPPQAVNPQSGSAPVPAFMPPGPGQRTTGFPPGTSGPSPTGVSVPGMIVPPPAPTVPMPAGAVPSQPVRRPGGQ
jgi:hypothetical protein